MRRRWIRILVIAGRRWWKHNSLKHAAALSFYTLFSLAPITLIAVTIAGAMLGREAAQGELAKQLTTLVGERGGAVIETVLAEGRPEYNGWAPGAMSALLLLVGATGVFVQLQDSLNEIWKTHPKKAQQGIWFLLTRRLPSFAMVLSIGFLLLVSLVMGTVITMLILRAQAYIEIPPILLKAADSAISLVVVSTLFAMIFKVLPDVRLKWSEVWRGAVFTALLFALGRVLISTYLARTGVVTTFGAAGSLVAFLIWIYYSASVLLFGASFTRTLLEDGKGAGALARRVRGGPRAPDKADADQGA